MWAEIVNFTSSIVKPKRGALGEGLLKNKRKGWKRGNLCRGVLILKRGKGREGKKKGWKIEEESVKRGQMRWGRRKYSS